MTHKYPIWLGGVPCREEILQELTDALRRSKQENSEVVVFQRYELAPEFAESLLGYLESESKFYGVVS